MDPLIPYSQEHSIKQVAASVFLSQEIINPSSFKQIIEEDFKKEYQQFKILKSIDFSFSGKAGNVKLEDKGEADTGFEFIKFDETGDIKNILRGLNEKQRNYYAFHSLKYKRWGDFKAEFISSIKTLSKHYQAHYKAISLLYEDEFFWNSEESIKISKVFKEDADILSKSFFQSQKTQLINQTEKKEGDKYLTNRIEINVNANNKTINIKHNFIIVFENDLPLEASLENNSLQEMFELAHKENKKVFCDLFTKSTIELINLNCL